MGREGGIEQRAVNRREAWALSFQGEAIVEDFWVAPGPGMYNIVYRKKTSKVLPAFIGFHKVGPLGEDRTELERNHPPLGIWIGGSFKPPLPGGRPKPGVSR